MTHQIPDFASPEEFAALCAGIAGRLHAMNRVAMGEQEFVWELAHLIERAGAALARRDDPGVQAAFGDGWTAGAVPPVDRPAALLALLYPPGDCVAGPTIRSEGA